MRLLYVADGGSPIARSWISHFAESDHEVHLVSTRPCAKLSGLQSLSIVPVAFSGMASGGMPGAEPGSVDAGSSLLTSAGTIGLRTFVRHWLGPFTVNRAAAKLRQIFSAIQPDLVHAMRIPFEGAMAAAAGVPAKLLVSVWGNDFTLHAPASPWMGRLTRTTLAKADALHTDCERDQRLAARYGFNAALPTMVSPGNGGVRVDIFHPGSPGEANNRELGALLRSLADEQRLIVNPRGFRAYVRNDSFFRAIPLVRAQHSETVFACVAMMGERRAERWIARLGIEGAVYLLPRLSRSDMAVLLRRSQIMLSPSEHDGTPNSLLEAMACGVYPIAGDLESIREWIKNGSNGSLVDAGRPSDIAGAVSQAISDSGRRKRAAAVNKELISARAEYTNGMARAEAFYEDLLS